MTFVMTPLTRALLVALTVTITAVGAPCMTVSAQPVQAPPVSVPKERSTPWFAPLPTDRLSPWFAPVLSAAVPGAGQGLLGQERGVAYLVAEAYIALQAVNAARGARRERDAYREIARTVARAPFGGARPDGPWYYYEKMQFALESGVFNKTPGNGFTPESDPATFNGSIWLLARETFWRDPDVAPSVTSPEYQRALDFYRRRAATDAYLWSWRDAQLAQDLFRQTIARSNQASRQAKQWVGLLLANHALSAVDAYVNVRLRVFGGTDMTGAQTVGVQGSVPLPNVPLTGASVR